MTEARNGSSGWTKLRQVVVATADHQGDLAAVRRAFGLGTGFADDEAAEMGLVDATLPVSSTTYLELVGPSSPSASVAKWLTKVGGRGGYALSVQHPSPASVKERAQARGIRVAADVEVFGYNVVQLHPAGLGLLLELDGIPDPDVWFWDDITPGPEKGALIDEIVAVHIPVANPAETLDLWQDLLGVQAIGPDEIDLSGVRVRFVEGGPSAEWTIQLRRAAGVGEIEVPDLAGIRFELC